jgi:hypothetical protein
MGAGVGTGSWFRRSDVCRIYGRGGDILSDLSIASVNLSFSGEGGFDILAISGRYIGKPIKEVGSMP